MTIRDQDEDSTGWRYLSTFFTYENDGWKGGFPAEIDFEF
jgi:hypothetical protein